MLDTKPDYEICRKRMEAWWHNQVVDRALCWITVRKRKTRPQPPSHHKSLRERWMDAEYVAECAVVNCLNTLYLGDAIPTAWPNLGPEVFSALFGCELEYGETTSWSRPILHSWADADRIRFNPDSIYYRKLHELTDALVAAGRGRFITGLTDFHPGGDHLAALRDPQRLALDLIEHPPEVKRFLERMEAEYFRIYDIFYHKLRAAGLPITTWLPAITDGKYYVPSNDFSCMISREMFNEFFLPGIINECRFLDRSIYHLDGPGALRHLDSLLEIKELNAVQWVCGAGNTGYAKWVSVYQRIQQASKGNVVYVTPDELPLVFDTLRPEGTWLNVSGVKSADEARAILRRVAKWK